MKRIRIYEEYCIGCRLCEIHCQVHHSNAKELIKAFRNERETMQPRVTVEEIGYHSFALQCRHCEDAPCIEACMTGALYRDPETGAVLCDEEKCVGCWMCIMVCPAGAIKQGTEDNIASKCDMCIGEDVPVCVANCPNEALVLEETDE
ncbi:MAG: 4Fe-4S dicluster domain-containing protein [Armatimonadota bacterium]